MSTKHPESTIWAGSRILRQHIPPADADLGDSLSNDLEIAGLSNLIMDVAPDPVRWIEAKYRKIDDIARWYHYCQTEGHFIYPASKTQYGLAKSIKEASDVILSKFPSDPEVRKRISLEFADRAEKGGILNFDDLNEIGRVQKTAIYLDNVVSMLSIAAQQAYHRSLRESGGSVSYPLETDLAKLLFRICNDCFSHGIAKQADDTVKLQKSAKDVLTRFVDVVMKAVGRKTTLTFAFNGEVIPEPSVVAKVAVGSAAGNLKRKRHEETPVDDRSDKGRSKVGYYKSAKVKKKIE